MSRLEAFWYGRAELPLWARVMLSFAAAVFGVGVALRDWAFRSGLLRTEQVNGLRVLSVGNLNVGGTGKTPAVIHLAQRLLRKGERVVVLSRGYGRTATHNVYLDSQKAPWPAVSETSDEPRLIASRCAGVPVLVGADRVELANWARTEWGATVAILDDGFQHRRLRRQVDVLVVDAEAAFGNGKLLPRGPLREPVSGMSRASLIWLNQSSSENALRFDAPVVKVRQVATGWVKQGQSVPLELLRGQRLLAFCAIARPERFWRTLGKLGFEVSRQRAFADHHRLDEGELNALRKSALAQGLTLVTTEKDWVRLPSSFEGYALVLDTEIVEGEALLERALETQ